MVVFEKCIAICNFQFFFFKFGFLRLKKCSYKVHHTLLIWQNNNIKTSLARLIVQVFKYITN